MNRFNVYMCPKYGSKYVEELSRYIEKEVFVVNNVNDIFFCKFSLFKLKKGDVFHMHWPSYLYNGSNHLKTLLKSIRFLLVICVLKLKGIRVIWTLHNIWPHKKGKTMWEHFVRTMICCLSNRIIILGETVKADVCKIYKINERKIDIIPHGHFRVYPTKGMDIRKKFNIPNNHFVYGFIGRIDRYKGIDELVEAFNSLQLDNISLLVAGKLSEGYNYSKLSQYANENVHFDLRFIEDDEIGDYLNSMDAMVLPFKDITTSGSAILALSYKVPVVAPNKGLLKEYIPENCGILYESNRQYALKTAMLEIRNLDRNLYNESYRNKMKELDWRSIAIKTIECYRKA